MKRIFLLIAGLCLLNIVQAQNRDALNLSSVTGYPLTVGSATIDSKQITENRLLPMNVELDSMPRFQIGAIPNQTVWHEGDITVGFYVLTDTLQSNNVTLSYTIDFQPEGQIKFNAQTGRFKYFPDKFDTRAFTVTFRAEAPNNAIVQDVLFTLMPATPPEYAAFGVEPIKPMPQSTDDYTIVAQTTQNNVPFNNTVKTVRSISITGKELVFDSHISNKLRYLNGSDDIKELNIFAEKVIVRDTLHFKQTNITIYAKELVFEDLPNQQPASINTSPVMFPHLPISNNNAKKGENAGNITLYIKEFRQSNPHIRFILVGGKGENLYWTTQQEVRTAGNGGNGGTITSTIDVSGLCDVIHGSAGIQIDGSNHIVGAGAHGQDGSFVLYGKEFTWLHPNFISAVVKHAKDAYLNIYNGFTYNIFDEYTKTFAELKQSQEWNELSDELQMEIDNANSEMQAVMFRIGQNLDYFGNPVGWVPMLSFEVNKIAFEQEIEKAIRVMYLSYWLKKVDQNNTNYTNACNEAIEQLKKELEVNEVALNQFVLLVPELQDELTALQNQLADLTVRIDQKLHQLLSQAEHNVKKRNRLNKIAGVLSAIAKVAPIADLVFPGVGTAISTAASIGNTALSIATGASDTYGYGNAAESALDAATSFWQNNGFSTISNALNSIDISSLGSAANTALSASATIRQTVTPLISSVRNLHEVFSKSSTPNSQVQAELNKLMAESREYQALIEEQKVLENNVAETMAKIERSLADIITKIAEIQNNIAYIDGLGRDVFNGNSKRDLRAMQYLDGMERRAKERLLKYHYYMAKAYEYRLLQPYTAELNLTNIFERFATIAEANPQQPVLNSNDFQNLKAVYEEQLSTVTANILDMYNNNRPELSVPVYFSLTQQDKDILNSGGTINLNIYERGMIPPDEENVRIVKFEVQDISVHLEGSGESSFAYFDLILEHSGRSMLRNKGEIYWFDHINSQNQNPITWGIRYDALGGFVNNHEPSFASQSLLYSLLDKLGQTNNIMIYSRPSAWADIRISKNDIAQGNTRLIIDNIVFKLQYDFVQRPTNNRNLDVYACDIDNSSVSLSPYIEVSRTDKCGRDNGRGTLYRTYNRGSSVILEAPAEYGRYQFVNWTNRYEQVVSQNTSVVANMSNDTWLKANYQYMGAILSMQDSVRVGKKDTIISVKVENRGSEEMEWSAMSNHSWIRILSGEEGFDTDFITLEIEENTTGANRTGSLTVTAPETAEYQKTFTVLQLNEELNIQNHITTHQSAVNIYQQNGTDNYTVILDNQAYTINMDVYTVTGQLVLRLYYYNTSTFDFNLSHCSKGMYIVKISYDKKTAGLKIVR